MAWAAGDRVVTRDDTVCGRRRMSDHDDDDDISQEEQ